MLFFPAFGLKWMWTWFRGESLIGEVWCRLTLYAAGLAYAHVQTVLGPVHTLQLLKVSPGVPDVDEGGSRRWKRVRGFSFTCYWSADGGNRLWGWFKRIVSSYTQALKDGTSECFSKRGKRSRLDILSNDWTLFPMFTHKHRPLRLISYQSCTAIGQEQQNLLQHQSQHHVC